MYKDHLLFKTTEITKKDNYLNTTYSADEIGERINQLSNSGHKISITIHIDEGKKYE
jgi:hypothetical protein